MGPIRCLACQRISRGGGLQGVDRSTSDPNPVCLTPIIMVQTEMTEQPEKELVTLSKLGLIICYAGQSLLT